MVPLYEDGQPDPRLWARRAHERVVAELLGVCKGIILDGAVTEGEAVGLKDWIASHPDAASEYPGGVLAKRLDRIFADGRVTEDERLELSDLLHDVSGERPEASEAGDFASTAFFDDPLPTVLVDGKEYVFTGRMLHATRAECEKAVIDRGGSVQGYVRRRTDFLVVGPMGSAAWLQSTHGTKLLHAAALRDKGVPIHIIPEEHWIRALEMGV